MRVDLPGPRSRKGCSPTLTHSALSLLSGLVILLAALACQGTQPTPSPTPLPDVHSILESSGEAMALLDSFHFQLSHNGGGTPLAEGLVIKEVDGDVVKPDKLVLKWQGTFGGFFVRADVIAVAGETYMTDPITRKWGSISGEVNPLGFFDPAVGIAAIMADLTDASAAGTARLDNTDTYRIQGRLPSLSLYPLLFTVAQDIMVETEVWIGADDGYMHQVVFRSRVTEEEVEGTTRIIRLSGFNAPVEIAAPNID